jgi:methylmalonyl-CoA/ethylmalonyl-CoA epimerase
MPNLNHIAVLIENLDEAMKTFNKIWGLEPDHIVVVADHGMRMASYHFDNIMIEVMEPYGENSGMAKALEKRGPGIHHIAIEADDVKARMDALKAEGFKFTSEEPTKGFNDTTICFLHPKSTFGILTELVKP